MSTRDHPDWWTPMGGQNSQDSILERRSLVWNDDGIVNGTVPALTRTAFRGWAKFFTRGCRGKIHWIEVYCIGDGVDELTLRYSPHPGTGPYNEVTIVPGAAWAWQPFLIREMWNYDGLFIWVHACGAAVSYAYDLVQPWDAHSGGVAEQYWPYSNTRVFIRVLYDGETPGDVPVSGTINVVEIPSVATGGTSVGKIDVAHNADVFICQLNGAGTMIKATLLYDTSVTPTCGAAPGAVEYELFIYVDGLIAYRCTNRESTQSCVATSGFSPEGVFWQASVEEPEYDLTVLSVIQEVKFRRSIALHAYQTTGALVTVQGAIQANMNR